MFGFSPVRLPQTPYVSGALNTYAAVDTLNTTSSFTVDTDWLVPFSVREPVPVGSLFWHRANTTPGNAHNAILDHLGNRLTDCAVDADTTAGFHVVSTTPVTLLPNRLYYGGFNQSVLIASRDTALYTDLMVGFASRPAMAAAPSIDPQSVNYSKARANAAFPAATTMTGFSTATLIIVGGFVKQ